MAGRGVKVLDNDRRRSGRRQRRHHDGQELARQRVPSRGPRQIGGRDGKGRRRPLAVRTLGGGDAVRIGDRQVLLWNRPGPGPCLVTAGIESPKSELSKSMGSPVNDVGPMNTVRPDIGAPAASRARMRYASDGLVELTLICRSPETISKRATVEAIPTPRRDRSRAKS